MFETALAQLAIVAAFTQKVLSLVKGVYQGSAYQKYFDLALSLVLSAVLCVAWGVDVFGVADIHFSIAWLGNAFTGVFAALGSNVLNDLLKLLAMWKEQSPRG